MPARRCAVFVILIALGGCQLNTLGIGDEVSSLGTTTTTDAPTEAVTTTEAPVCGDGVVGGGEQCDDGNQVDADACTNACTLPICGDGVVNPGEACDDGNTESGDMCSAACTSTEIVGLDVSARTACVVFADGGGRCWGDGDFGQLGTGTLELLGDAPGEVPVKNIAIDGSFAQIAIGARHACGRLATGKVRCWGDNAYGQLGYGDLLDRVDLPTPDLEIPEQIIDISAGDFHTCAVVEGGAVRCWGKAAHLGYGSISNVGDTADDLPLVANLPNLAGIAQVVAGPSHTCARTATGAVYCWGDNSIGELGLGRVDPLDGGPDDAPELVDIGAGESAIGLSLGSRHTCVLLTGGKVRCWGEGSNGALGQGDIESLGDEPEEMPPNDVELGGLAMAVGAGASHSCALRDDGRVVCWGHGASGHLGNGAVEIIGDDPGEMPPIPIDLGVGSIATKLSTRAAESTCVVLQVDGSQVNRLSCWGWNLLGQLGLGHTMSIGDDELPSETPYVPF